MCGIAGVLDRKNSDVGAIGAKMTKTLIHRGPDDDGLWVDTDYGIALGHRRLSIIDLSPEGHQPMVSASGRYVTVFNGEIYNYKAIRRELEQLTDGKVRCFRGHSDTEVMLEAIETWGLEEAVRRFIGMFAFALWDCKEKVLYLVRDRLGEKPVYYATFNNSFSFASELKAFHAHPHFKPDISRNSVALYLRYNYIPAPYSIYEGVFKLIPGTILTVNSNDDISISGPRPYWSPRKVAEEGAATFSHGSEKEMIDQLDKLLSDSVEQQMIADVPLGAFLSGGIDSSVVVALMQAQSNSPVRTFTIGFHESSYNEAEHAKAVARHLGTDHTELYVTPQEAIDVIPKLPVIYDEPFADSSQIPTFLVSALARQHVTVSLSGDGGDELFGGYNRYFWGRRIWQKIGWLPQGIRQAISGSIRSVSPQTWNHIIRRFSPILPTTLKHGIRGDRLHKLSEIMAVKHAEEIYHGLVSHWKNPASIVLGAVEPLTMLTDTAKWAGLPDFTQRMMYLDMITYLPDDILVKVDRASMAVSLESRVPMLDHRVVEFAWQVPLSMKIRGGQGKWLLRQVLYKYVPRKLVERPKMGFGVPIDSWLRGPLRDWAEDLLDESRLRREGIFKPAPIREKWDEHLAGTRDWQYHLWDVLMFQAWHSVNKNGYGS